MVGQGFRVEERHIPAESSRPKGFTIYGSLQLPSQGPLHVKAGNLILLCFFMGPQVDLLRFLGKGLKSLRYWVWGWRLKGLSTACDLVLGEGLKL